MCVLLHYGLLLTLLPCLHLILLLQFWLSGIHISHHSILLTTRRVCLGVLLLLWHLLTLIFFNGF
jgi:hypothetical protein